MAEILQRGEVTAQAPRKMKVKVEMMRIARVGRLNWEPTSVNRGEVSPNGPVVMGTMDLRKRVEIWLPRD